MPCGQENSVEHPDGQQGQEGIRHLGPQSDDDPDEERAEDEESVGRRALTDDVEIVEDDAWCGERGEADEGDQRESEPPCGSAGTVRLVGGVGNTAVVVRRDWVHTSTLGIPPVRHSPLRATSVYVG